MQVYLVLAILAASTVCFALEVTRPEVVAVGVMLALVGTGLLTPAEAFSGFGDPAVVTVVAMFVVGGGLVQTGVAGRLARGLLLLAGRDERRLVGLVVLATGLISTFINNIGATAIMVPAVLGVARRARLVASRLLIPVSFGSLLGGLITLVGTPPNIIVTSVLAQHGYAPFRLFDFTPTGLAFLLAGAAVMALTGRRLLPELPDPARDDLADVWELGAYLSEVIVLRGSRLAGRTLAQSRLGAEFDLTVLGVYRGAQLLEAAGDLLIEPGDRLLVEGSRDDLLRLKAAGGVELAPGADPQSLPESLLQMAEAVPAPGSRLLGHTLRELDFRRRYDLTVLGIRRSSHRQRTRLARVRLRLGDTLLVYGPTAAIRALAQDRDFLLLQPVKEPARLRPGHAPQALAVLGLTVALAGLGIAPIAVSASLGALLMMVLGCVRPEDAREMVDWPVVVLLGALLPLGIAMQKTGAATTMAGVVLRAAGGSSPLAALAIVFGATALLTQAMSNAATAVVMAPVAIAVSSMLGISPHPLLMGVAVAASSAFLTPVSHQSNLLVYGAAGYRYLDFVRAGLPVTVSVMALALGLIPRLWPF